MPSWVFAVHLLMLKVNVMPGEYNVESRTTYLLGMSKLTLSILVRPVTPVGGHPDMPSSLHLRYGITLIYLVCSAKIQAGCSQDL